LITQQHQHGAGIGTDLSGLSVELWASHPLAECINPDNLVSLRLLMGYGLKGIGTSAALDEQQSNKQGQEAVKADAGNLPDHLIDESQTPIVILMCQRVAGISL
jgi:hypothetical protein